MHVRFSDQEFCALEAAAAGAGLTISGFVRSLSLEGAGVCPFLSNPDQAIFELLHRDLLAVGSNLNQMARALNAGQPIAASDLAGRINDAHAVAITIATELAQMTRRAASARRGEMI